MRIANFAVVAALSLAPIALAQEKKIERKDLPPAVEKTVAAQSQGATIRGFSQEKENGQLHYEAELTVNGHSKDILIDANGAVVEVEEQVAIDSLPAPVKDGLQARVGNGKILKVESLTKKNKLVAYEAVVQSTGKKKEIQIGPDGQPLAHEE
jgi:uncharacterized membrane protein YkoI